MEYPRVKITFLLLIIVLEFVPLVGYSRENDTTGIYEQVLEMSDFRYSAPDRTIQFMDSVAGVLQKYPNDELLGHIYFFRASSLLGKRLFDQSLDYFDKSYQIAKKLNDREKIT